MPLGLLVHTCSFLLTLCKCAGVAYLQGKCLSLLVWVSIQASTILIISIEIPFNFYQTQAQVKANWQNKVVGGSSIFRHCPFRVRGGGGQRGIFFVSFLGIGAGCGGGGGSDQKANQDILVTRSIEYQTDVWRCRLNYHSAVCGNVSSSSLSQLVPERWPFNNSNIYIPWLWRSFSTLQCYISLCSGCWNDNLVVQLSRGAFIFTHRKSFYNWRERALITFY